MAKGDNGLRKRQQIEAANRTMFLWVAIASVVVGVALVLSYALYQQLVFKQRIIGEKNHTVATLKNNNQVVDKLNENVRVLNSNQALQDTPHPDGTEAISVVLDALPSQANSSALGASFQQKLLDVKGVKIESLTVNPISGVEDSGGSSDSSTTTDTTNLSGNEISFQFSVSTSAQQVSALKQVLKNLERSIRAIDATTLQIEQHNNTVTMTVDGHAFYQPEKHVELQDKAIKP